MPANQLEKASAAERVGFEPSNEVDPRYAISSHNVPDDALSLAPGIPSCPESILPTYSVS